MGLFDGLKDVLKSSVESVISNEASKVMQQEGEKIGSQVKDGMKSYLESAKESVSDEDGKKSIDSLINLMDDSENAMNESVKVDGETEEATRKVEEDFKELGEATHTDITLETNYDK